MFFCLSVRRIRDKKLSKALKNMVLGSGIRDPRSRIRKKPIPDPGSRGQKGTGSRIRNTAVFCVWLVGFGSRKFPFRPPQVFLPIELALLALELH